MKPELRFYCLRGKHRVETSDYNIIRMKNGRRAAKALCHTHNMKLYRILGKEKSEKDKRILNSRIDVLNEALK